MFALIAVENTAINHTKRATQLVFGTALVTFAAKKTCHVPVRNMIMASTTTMKSANQTKCRTEYKP